MRRKSSRYDTLSNVEDLLVNILIFCAIIVFIYMLGLYFTNKTAFWKDIIYGVIGVVAIGGILFTLGRFLDNLGKKRWLGLLDEIKQNDQEENIRNFINRFGLEGRNVQGWSFRNHVFDYDRIRDLEKEIIESGIKLRTGKKREIFNLLQYYIQQKEEGLTRESIKREPQKFAVLSGNDFEKLLYRLFEAMGYKTEHVGHSGDQGGDLIANRGGERILIQAKAYRDWSTGNDAVQQVVGATRYYECNKAIVVTTSHFTPEAITLAKANNTELISKDRLSELLLQYLHESWG